MPTGLAYVFRLARRAVLLPLGKGAGRPGRQGRRGFPSPAHKSRVAGVWREIWARARAGRGPEGAALPRMWE